jgi:hypothetical protein
MAIQIFSFNCSAILEHARSISDGCIEVERKSQKQREQTGSSGLDLLSLLTFSIKL